jgi:hypothetical protein
VEAQGVQISSSLEFPVAEVANFDNSISPAVIPKPLKPDALRLNVTLKQEAPWRAQSTSAFSVESQPPIEISSEALV